ncbi:MAG: radical SAM protein, partial [Candidatus Muiribacteriota bacterium]
MKRDISIICGIAEKCNLKCIYCPQNSQVYGAEGVNSEISTKNLENMSFDTFRKVYDNIDGVFDEFHFAGFGEPLINKDFLQIFDYALKNNNDRFDKFYVFTNATLMNKELTDKIIKGIQKNRKQVYFIFSVGTDNQNTYKKLKNSDSLNIVKTNIIYFLNQVKSNNLWDKVK